MHTLKPVTVLVVCGLTFLVLGALVRLTELTGTTGAVGTLIVIAITMLAAIAAGERGGGRPRTPYW